MYMAQNRLPIRYGIPWVLNTKLYGRAVGENTEDVAEILHTAANKVRKPGLNDGVYK